MKKILALSLSTFALSGCEFGKKSASTDHLREPQSEKIQANSLTLGRDGRLAMIPITAEEVKSVLGTTMGEDYVFPLSSGSIGAGGQAWCGCRSEGTNPHVGQDYINVPGNIQSVAMANGKVVGVGLIDKEGSCGYAVEIIDGLQVLWRYLHMNFPLVKTGDFVKKGQLLGTHSKYPRPGGGCGTGAHLHLERRWLGELPGQFGSRSCPGSQLINCNADPVSPLKDKPQIGKNLSTPPPKPANIDTRPICDFNQPESSVVREVPSPGGRIPSFANSYLNNFKADIHLVSAQKNRFVVRIGKVTLFNSNQESDLKNRCGLDLETGAKESCITRWELQVTNDAGEWKSVFNDQNVRNLPLRLVANYCLPADTTKFPSKYRIIATTEGKRTLIQDGEFTAVKK